MLSVRIQTLQWIGGALAAICCLLLGGWILLANLADHSRFAEGAETYRKLYAALEAASAVSSERGPSNSAMASTPENATELQTALLAKRAQTDATITALTTLFAHEIYAYDDVRINLLDLREALARGRAAVDVAVYRAAGTRTGEDVAQAIELMFAASDEAMALRNTLGQYAIRLTPQISTDIVLVTAASDLREYEGRLGSYVVMMLTSDPQADARHAIGFYQMIARLAALRETLNVYSPPYFDNGTIAALQFEVDEGFFKGAINFASEIATIHGPTNGLSAAEFTRAYVPMMATSEALREAIAAASQKRLQSLRDGALTSVILSAALTAIILLVLYGLAMTFRSRLFGPLLAVREQVMAIAEGDFSDPPPARRHSREIQPMFVGLGVLRDQLRQKRLLEVEQQRLTDKLKTLAETDALTGLPNRRAITETARHLLARIDQHPETVAVIMLDVDHFKQVNDGFGHEVGDLVLQRVAEILSPLLGRDDMLARYGGEEFVALLRSTDETSALAIAEQMRGALEQATIVSDQTLRISGSFGVSVRSPATGAAWDDLIAEADRHLYRAKRAGRNRVFGPDLSAGHTALRAP